MEMGREAVVTWIEKGHSCPWKRVGDQRWNQGIEVSFRNPGRCIL